jgi:multiple sugar transport system substrate-binding protein
MPAARHPILRSLALLFALAFVVGACAPAAEQPTPAPGTPAPGTPAPGTPGPETPGPETPGPETPEPGTPDPGAGGEVVMLSTQLVPLEEAEKMRNVILADYPGGFPGGNFVGAEEPDFIARVEAEAVAGEGGGEVGVLGGLHGNFSPLVERGLLMDLSDLAAELEDVGLIDAYMDMGRFGTDQQLMIPWMQATYIMAATTEAMDYLPDGADPNALTWDDVTNWGRNITEAGHGQRLGFPAGDQGLWHRFFQGFGIPAYTGRVNTAFNSPDAVQMWEWLRETWEYVNPQSSGYGFMQDPLQTGEVWVAWDHVARLRDAFTANPDNFVALPAPAGPQGRAFMPVVAGLAIPNSAPDVEAARNLIRYLTRPETSATTLREVGFFPATTAELPEGLDPGIQAMSDAVVTMTSAPDALAAFLPVGLGEHGGAYNQVFRDTFESIVIGGQDIQQVLDREAANLQSVLDTAGTPCWPPDPPSDGACQVE